MAAGGLVPSQTYKDLAACADNTAVQLLARGVRLFFLKSLIRLDRVKQNNNNKNDQ